MHESYESSRPVVNLVRRDMALREPLLGAPSRRHRRIFAMILLAGMLLLGIYLFLQTGLFLGHLEEKLRVPNRDTAKIRIYNEQFESLQDRMTGFIAGSVETKLRMLEHSVASGTVGAQEIRTFEELKSELKLLETYAAGKVGNALDQSRFEHQRFQVSPGSSQSVSDGDLMRELSQLKNLFYFGIASCGVIAGLIGGYWWQHNAREKRLQSHLSRTPLLANRRNDE